VRVLKRLFAVLFMAVALSKNGFAQKALTWQEVRDKFEAANPTLGRDELVLTNPALRRRLPTCALIPA
jgi:hypothetical protein